MTKPCPSCGAATIPDARFCRRCGTLLRVGAQDNGSEMVSPLAATVPLTDEGRTTDGLSPNDPRRPAADTTRVNQTELDAILRSTQDDAPSTIGQATIPYTGQNTFADADAPPRDTSDLNSVRESPADYTTKVGTAYTEPDAYAEQDNEELTITVPRRTEPFSEPSAPLRVQPIPVVRASAPLSEGAPQLVDSVTPVVVQGASPKESRRVWPVVVAVCCAVLLMAIAGVMLVSRLRSRPAPADLGNTAPPVAANDPKKLSEDKMSEAEALLASGDLNGAIARLREAVQLDASSIKAHRRLAEVLLESGARREAIEEFRAVTQADPNDFTAWRALAFAQLGEGLYEESAESFRRLLALTAATAQDPNDLLSYADALRQAGRAEEARAVYQTLSSVSNAEVADAARRHLAELSAAQPSPTPTPARSPSTDVAQNQNPETTQTPVVTLPTPPPQATPTPARATPTPATPPQTTPSTPEEHYARGVSLWSSNRAAALQEFRSAGRQHPDANYYLGLSYVEGRDLRSLKRAEIVAALGHFQIARRGRFSGQAQQYERQLGREFDRLRN